MIFEAPQRSQQAWLLRRVGPNVNLGNIGAEDVIALETLRRGLRFDTLDLLPRRAEAARARRPRARPGALRGASARRRSWPRRRLEHRVHRRGRGAAGDGAGGERGVRSRRYGRGVELAASVARCARARRRRRAPGRRACTRSGSRGPAEAERLGDVGGERLRGRARRSRERQALGDRGGEVDGAGRELDRAGDLAVGVEQVVRAAGRRALRGEHAGRAAEQRARGAADHGERVRVALLRHQRAGAAELVADGEQAELVAARRARGPPRSGSRSWPPSRRARPPR